MRLRALLATMSLLGSAIALVPAGAQADSSTDYQTGYTLGHEAYEYGRPLLDTERVFSTYTSINIPDDSGDGPVNHFNSFKRLTVATKTQRTVVAPNSDTLYSMAWLDLRHEPQVIHVPAIRGRFYCLEMLTPWTENFYNITSLSGPSSSGTYSLTSGGNFAVVNRTFHGVLPHGVRRIVSPYSRVWIIGRTYIHNEADTPAVNAIQRQYTITPLSRWGTAYTAPVPSHPVTTLRYATIAGTQPGQDPLAYYTSLNRELARFGPMSGDGPLLKRLRTIGVGAGLNPATDPRLSPQMLQGMRDAVAQGVANLKGELKSLYLSNALKHNGYLVVSTGTYGTDYQLRAEVDYAGLGAPLPYISVYPMAQTDNLLQPLSGTNKYVLHIPAGGLPPVQAFWSLTMYDANGDLVPNVLRRYVLNNRSSLHHNSDGSLDLYVQHTAPSDAAQLQNWLPAPAGNFRLMWRLYGLGSAMPGVITGSGWRPPTVQNCALGQVGVPALTKCAS